jgi:hypothetical protein
MSCHPTLPVFAKAGSASNTPSDTKALIVLAGFDMFHPQEPKGNKRKPFWCTVFKGGGPHPLRRDIRRDAQYLVRQSHIPLRNTGIAPLAARQGFRTLGTAPLSSSFSLVLMSLRCHICFVSKRQSDPADLSGVVYETTRLIRVGAAGLVQAVPEENTFFLYGPGFEIKITRTDPDAWDPKSERATGAVMPSFTKRR